MFGLGITEIVLILVVALLFLGPDKLPEVAKSLGKGLREFRKITDDVRDTVNQTVVTAAREVAKPTPAPGATPDPLAAAAPNAAPSAETPAPAEPAEKPLQTAAVEEERVPSSPRAPQA
jgi:sec-independent protein translocase protein TatB